jgi:glucokinase
MRKVALGVDIGGQSVKLGLVNTRGKILQESSFLTREFLGRKRFFKELKRSIEALLRASRRRNCRVTGIGIGAPGPIDVERGFVYFFPNIPGWRNTPLKSRLEKVFKMRVCVDNDANVMALAELRFGAGQGVQNLIALTLGTGIGGGLVVHGKLFHGPSFSAAEIGHVVIDERGKKCACGSHGCVETFVGTDYFVQEVKKRLRSGQKSILNQWLKSSGRCLTPQLVAKAARHGDSFSKKMWEETGAHLGTALAGLVNVFNPERIVLGGGIAQNGNLIFKPVVRTLRKKAFPIASRSVKVVRAALGVNAGVVGAAALLFENS